MTVFKIKLKCDHSMHMHNFEIVYLWLFGSDKNYAVLYLSGVLSNLGSNMFIISVILYKRIVREIAERLSGGGTRGWRRRRRSVKGDALDRRGERGAGGDARAPCVLPKLFGARCTIDFSRPMRKILRGGAGVVRREEGGERGGHSARGAGGVQRGGATRAVPAGGQTVGRRRH